MAGLGVSGEELSLAQNQFAFNKTSLSVKEKEALYEILRKVYKSVDNWTGYVGSETERNSLKKELKVLWQNLPAEIISLFDKLED